jgi:hypothetical protein
LGGFGWMEMARRIITLLKDPKITFYVERNDRRGKKQEQERLHLNYIRENLSSHDFEINAEDLVKINYVPIAKRIIGFGSENSKFDSTQEILKLKNFSLHSNLSTIFENLIIENKVVPYFGNIHSCTITYYPTILDKSLKWNDNSETWLDKEKKRWALTSRNKVML